MRFFILVAVLLAAALVTPVCTLAGCALHNPPPGPLTPPYPDPVPFGGARDAGHE